MTFRARLTLVAAAAVALTVVAASAIVLDASLLVLTSRRTFSGPPPARALDAAIEMMPTKIETSNFTKDSEEQRWGGKRDARLFVR